MGLYNDDVDHLCSVQRGYKSCCISGPFILNDEEFRTYVRANKIKQVPGDLSSELTKTKQGNKVPGA